MAPQSVDGLHLAQMNTSAFPTFHSTAAANGACVVVWMEDGGMAQAGGAGEFGAVMASFTQVVAARLAEAAALARTASALGAEGLAERAFQTLLDAEPLLHDAQLLLNASSVLRRHDRGEPPFG